MSGELEFMEDKDLKNTFKSRTILAEKAEPKIISWLVKHKLFKDKKTATRILIILLVVMVILSLAIFTKGKIFGIGVLGPKSKGDIEFYIPELGRSVVVPEGERISKFLNKYKNEEL